MTDNTEAIRRELGLLVRSAKELHHMLPDHSQPTLDPPAYILLFRIAEQGPLRLSTLAGSVLLDVSTVSRQVQELEHSGWVVRERDPQDGRASLFRLTAQGQSVLDAGHEARSRALRQMLADWTDDQRHTLAEQLGRFNDAIAAFRRTTHLSTDLRQENVT